MTYFILTHQDGSLEVSFSLYNCISSSE